MRGYITIGGSLLVLASTLVSCDSEKSLGPENEPGRVIVANRGAASLTVIDAAADTVLQTLALPSGSVTPEPVYLAYTRAGNRLWVGDRGNDRLLVYDARTLTQAGTVATGKGNAHIAVSSDEKQLWISNDIDNTLTVVDPATLAVVRTITLASDLNTSGGKVHDIAIDVPRAAAYVSVRNVAGDDWVVSYNIQSFAETGRQRVGENPHVAIDGKGGVLQVMAENGFVRSFDATLAKQREAAVTGAHGATLSADGKILYVANFLSTDGVSALVALRTSDLTQVGSSISTTVAKPHHLLVSPGGRIYVTHSAANLDKVTVYSIDAAGAPAFVKAVTVGINPQGIVWVP